MDTTLNIALAGNPNCGKTTLFNELTGSNGYVGNWPGVTVEKLEAPLREDRHVVLCDLPGIYSLSPYSPEEVVSRDYLLSGEPAVVIDVVDATNLERNLYLTTQILECGLPCVVALNMVDLVEKAGDKIDVQELSARLGCPVVPISALRRRNLDELVAAAKHAAAEKGQPPVADLFSAPVAGAVQEISQVIAGFVPRKSQLAWYAVKAFEGERQALEALGLPAASVAAVDAARAGVEAQLDDDAESLVTNDRYAWIERLMDQCVTKAPQALTTSEKIDRVVTNCWLGLPIFVAVMVLVYFLAVSTVGTWGTDWANDGLFGDGWFVNPAQAAAYEEAQKAYAEKDYGAAVEGYLAAAEEAGVDTSGVAEAIEQGGSAAVEDFASRAAAAGVVAHDVPLHDEDGNFLSTEGDVVLANAADEPQLKAGQALAYHEPVDSAAFLEAANAQEPIPGEYGWYVPGIPTVVGEWLDSLGASDLVKSLVLDGVVGGVGSILGFLPQMIVLFLLLCFLEDCGYMSRVAFVMDRAFRRFGLSG